jgi:hypothetical protein
LPVEPLRSPSGEPGSYVFVCFFPDPEGTPHAALGMYELFTIAGDTGPCFLRSSPAS